jgi:alginate O-acetyltransferase complex protein AlgI
MKFNSFDYLFFFPAVVAVYFALPFRLRRAWLLCASLFFYMYWSAVFVLLIFYTTTIDYFVTLRLAHVRARGARRGLLAMSYVSNFGALVLFKYCNFFMDSWGAVRPSRLSPSPCSTSASRPAPLSASPRTSGTSRT